MKSFTQIFAALVATLATFSQSAIAAPTSTFFQNSSIDGYSSLDLGNFSGTQSVTPVIAKANNRSALVGNEAEVQKAVSEIQSVSQVKGSLKDLISPCPHGCSGYGLHLKAVRICTLVQALDVKTGEKILQNKSLGSNKKVISINRADRDLMKIIYSQCKLYKRLPSDSPELTYSPTTNSRQKIENLLLKTK